MKLSEKIYYYRKKTGKSQEELAEQIGVSRQAVSKWETGESEPEITKLKTLAAVFGVTVDFLLTEEEPPEAQAGQPTGENPSADRESPNYPKWLDRAPGFIGRGLRRFGWIAGVYTAVIGAFFLLIGGAATVISSLMVRSFESSVDSMIQEFGSGFYGNPFESAFPQVETFNPVGALGAVIMVIGAVFVIGGIILAVWLKKKGKQ